MAKGLYIGVGDKARKVKKIYVGVGDKARKVKKAYIGVNGVARVFYKPELVYNGKSSNGLTLACAEMVSTTVGNYAVFGGGVYRQNSDNVQRETNTVHAISNTLTVTKPTGFTQVKRYHAGTNIGNSYAVFGGGYDWNQSSTNAVLNTMDAYNTGLTRSTGTLYKGQRLGAASVGNYAIFAGGMSSNLNSATLTTAYSVNTSLTASAITSLGKGLYSMATASVGNYALFTGGNYYSGSSTTKNKTVYTYNSSLTHSTASASLTNETFANGLSFGNYALFEDNQNKTSNIDVFNTSLTKSSITFPTRKYGSAGCTANSEYAVYMCGTLYDGKYASADTNGYIIDSSLTITVINTGLERGYIHGASVGDYLVFAGGRTSISATNSYTNTIYTFSMG